MLKYQTLFTSSLPSFIHKDYIFLDIESTGLNSKNSILYLIGFIVFTESNWYQIQLINEDGESEAEIIKHFFTYLTQKSICIHYNGTTFDIPYLKGRCEQLSISTQQLESLQQYDYYLNIRPLQPILQLKNCKQHTVEAYAGFIRHDTLSGKELIQQYFLYLKLKQESALKAILLHNEDDLKGLTFISFFSSFIFAGTNSPVYEVKVKEQKGDITTSSLFLEIKFPLPFSFPTSLSMQKTFPTTQPSKKEDTADSLFPSYLLSFTCEKNICSIQCSLLPTTLKLFYKNYKDYYYLPIEDMAIHKSVASFVDKEHRQKATPNNCYLKKSGLFLPILGNLDDINHPVFYHSHSDKQAYLLFDEDNFQEFQSIWVNHALMAVKLPKPPSLR